MKLNLVIFVLITILPYSQAKAELMDPDTYDRETIYIHYSFLGNGFVKNGNLISLGAFGSNLAKEMTGSESALEEMRKARKYKISSTVANIVATGFGITGIIMIFTDDDDSRAFDITSIVIGGVCDVIAEAFDRSAMAAMNRAVWLYNRDIVSGLSRH